MKSEVFISKLRPKMDNSLFRYITKNVKQNRTEIAKSDFSPFYLRHLPTLCFHNTHGENITLSIRKDIANRFQHMSDGILFSNRPIMIEEQICIRLIAFHRRSVFSQNNGTGTLRVGVCRHDPSLMSRPLPKYVSPHLTSKEGYWAKPLTKRSNKENTLIHFHISNDGKLLLGVDGREKGVWLSGIDMSSPLWVIIDLYGKCTTVRLWSFPPQKRERQNITQNDTLTEPQTRFAKTRDGSLEITMM